MTKQHRSIEEFKNQIIKNTENTLSKSDLELWDSISEEQRQYGDDYKPKKKRSIFGTKEVCPNCSEELRKRYLGKELSKMFGEYWYYYIKSCVCGYKFVELKTGE